MATAEQINRFFPKAAGVDEHASKVATVEIPPTDLMLTADGAPVLWIKAKKNEDGVIVCVYTTIGADFSFAVSESEGKEPKKRSSRVQKKSKQKRARK